MSPKSFLHFLCAGENPLKNIKKLMHYFNVILLSDVILAFGPKVTRRVTYMAIYGRENYMDAFGIKSNYLNSWERQVFVSTQMS